jgi:hypothetical protein
MDTLELDIAPVVGEQLQSAFSDLASDPNSMAEFDEAIDRAATGQRFTRSAHPQRSIRRQRAGILDHAAALSRRLHGGRLGPCHCTGNSVRRGSRPTRNGSRRRDRRCRVRRTTAFRPARLVDLIGVRNSSGTAGLMSLALIPVRLWRRSRRVYPASWADLGGDAARPPTQRLSEPRTSEPGDRRPAVRQPGHRGMPPVQSVPQARVSSRTQLAHRVIHQGSGVLHPTHGSERPLPD